MALVLVIAASTRKRTAGSSSSCLASGAAVALLPAVIMRLPRHLVARYVLGVFTRPDDLTEGQIWEELAVSWDFAAQTLSYLPVGFGSHHWRAADAAGRELFLIVHDLPGTLCSRLDTPEAAFGRLETAFGCALSLRRDASLEFVIAPVPTVSGKVVRRVSERYSLAACPYLTDCEPGHEGEFPEADRPAVMRLLARHAAGVIALMTADT
jgi:hypothetical protein